jgi:hypothetical protein
VIEAARLEVLAEKANEHSNSEQQINEQSKLSLANKKIDGLDITKGIERYHGDENAYLRILSTYTKGVRSMLGAIETVTDDGVMDYKIKVHGIKGASYDIFADQVGKEAELLEFAAVDGNLDLIRERNPAFLEAAGKFIDNIEDVLALFIEDETLKPEKDKPDNEVLLKLLEACKVHDMENADIAMTEIEQYQYTADDGLTVWLRENVDMINFIEIAERLSDYLET